MTANMWAALIAVEMPKEKRVPYRRYPVSIRRPIVEGIKRLQAWLLYCKLETDWLQVLNEYRSNKVCGVTNPHFLIEMNRKHAGLFEVISNLDDAFSKLHNYRPEDHLSEGVYKLVQGENAKKARPNARTRASELKKIGSWLKSHGYKTSSDKSTIIREAKTHFTCSESDVREAAKRAKLTRSYSQSLR